MRNLEGKEKKKPPKNHNSPCMMTRGEDRNGLSEKTGAAVLMRCC